MPIANPGFHGVGLTSDDVKASGGVGPPGAPIPTRNAELFT